jgi:hypothetical protein
MFPVEIWQSISEYLGTEDFLALSSCSREIRSYICFYRAYKPRRIDLYLYRNLKQLSAVGSYDLTLAPLSLTSLDISHNDLVQHIALPNLLEFRGHRSRCLTLDTPKLKRLSIPYSEVPDLSSIHQLEFLNVAGTSVTDSQLRGLTIERLIAYHCPNIRDLTSLTRLTYLDVSWNSQITPDSFAGLPLVWLDISHTRLTEVGDIPSLETLIARGCGLTSVPPNITYLDLTLSTTKLDLRNTRIKKLKIANSPIDLDAISGLDLVKLDIDDNPHVDRLTPFPNLRTLRAGGRCRIDQRALESCRYLTSLYIRHNTTIYDISALTRLRKLGVDPNCPIPLDTLRTLGFRPKEGNGIVRYVRGEI